MALRSVEANFAQNIPLLQKFCQVNHHWQLPPLRQPVQLLAPQPTLMRSPDGLWARAFWRKDTVLLVAGKFFKEPFVFQFFQKAHVNESRGIFSLKRRALLGDKIQDGPGADK